MIAHLILYCLCMATLIGMAAFALEGGLRLFHHPTRRLWAAAVVAAVVIPALSVATPTVAPAMLEPALPGAVLATDRTAELLGEALSPLAAWNDALTIFWISGSGLLALVIGASLVRLAHCRRRWREEVFLGRRVFVSSDVGPAVVGVVQPSIVLPEWALQVDRASQELIVAHEQEHIHAGDHRLLALAAAALVLMPWNLPLWWMVRRLRLAIEIDCDARVLHGVRSGLAAYGTLLLEVGRRISTCAAPLTAFSNPASSLEHRIRAMTVPSNPRGRPLRAAGLALAAVAAISVAWVTPGPLRGSCYGAARVTDGWDRSALVVGVVERPSIRGYIPPGTNR